MKKKQNKVSQVSSWTEKQKWLAASLVITAVTALFAWYHNGQGLKNEYDAICHQNYGDPITFNRCMDTYGRHAMFYNTALLLTGGVSIAFAVRAYNEPKTKKKK
jgi:heme/copper-type cytochrome/quinol oxidase subunit 3